MNTQEYRNQIMNNLNDALKITKGIKNDLIRSAATINLEMVKARFDAHPTNEINDLIDFVNVCDALLKSVIAMTDHYNTGWSHALYRCVYTMQSELQGLRHSFN